MTRVVCTIARGRERHLHAMMQALGAQELLPDLLVIGVMQPEPYVDLPEMPFPVQQIVVSGSDAPLAKARNACAHYARARYAEEGGGSCLLVFLDVDCIAAPDLVAAFDSSVRPGTCVMGRTLYLAKEDDPASCGFETLWDRAAIHPARDFTVPKGAASLPFADMGEFWSLSFALFSDDFERTGGFDERFVGYGGEDTDFACAMGQAGLQLHWDANARAVHQWHAVHIPPLGHLEPIVRNARLFRAKHGRWCMEYWLGQLAAAGYVAWDAEGSRLAILRRPSLDELEAAVQGGDVRFS